MAWDKYQVLDLVSVDLFMFGLPGWILEGYVSESKNDWYHGVTVINDVESGIFLVENQVSLGARN